MIVTFFGHASFQRTKQIEQQMLDALEQTVNGRPAEFYLGGYGAFDSFAYECAKRYKQTHPETRLVFVTPYLRQERLEYEKTRYDLIVYPPLENVPLRFAISHRNRYMVLC